MQTLSITKEDYLRAMYKLKMEKSGKIRITDLAKELQIGKSTATESLQKLAHQKLVIYAPYTLLDFSKKGFKIAEKLTYKHRIIEVFLHDILKISKDKIHEEAHRLEHAFSDESIEKIAHLVGNPTTDPHGQPIPQK